MGYISALSLWQHMFAVILKCIPVYSRAEPTPDWLTRTAASSWRQSVWLQRINCGALRHAVLAGRSIATRDRHRALASRENIEALYIQPHKSLSHIYTVAFSTLRTSTRPWRQWTDRWTAFITPSLRRTASCSPRSRSEKDTPVKPNTLQSF